MQMAEWIKKNMKLKKVTRLLKDQVSLGLAISRVGKFSQIEMAIHQAINHDERVPDEGSIRAVLKVGRSSRMHVSYCVGIIMDKLNRTQSCIVALKCLIVIHRCIYEGGFMLQDQLSIRPARGGRNYLNMSMFRDSSSVQTLEISSFIRLYAGFLEQWLITSRVIKDFLDMKPEDQELHTEKLKAMMNKELTQEILSLHDLLHQVSGWEIVDLALKHPLVKEALKLTTLVTSKVYGELKSRFKEVQARLGTLHPSQASALINVCEQLSRDSTTHIYFFELCYDDSQTDSGEVVFNDYELLNLKKMLESASRPNMQTVSGLSNVVEGNRLQLVTQSMRFAKPVPMQSRRRGDSMSDFNSYEKFPIPMQSRRRGDSMSDFNSYEKFL